MIGGSKAHHVNLSIEGKADSLARQILFHEFLFRHSQSLHIISRTSDLADIIPHTSFR